MGATSEQYVAAQTWLSTFSAAVSSNDAKAVASTFLAFGWFRDVLTFVWDNRSLSGPEQITAYLAEDDRLAKARLSSIKLDEDPYFQPASTVDPDGTPGIDLGFVFETPIAHGKGFTRLRRDALAQWKALTVFTMIVDLKGHEERAGLPDYESDDKTWTKVFQERRTQVEANPYVLIGMSAVVLMCMSVEAILQ